MPPEPIKRRCPTCGNEFELGYQRSDPSGSTMPFCSERCRDADLGRWLTEQYSVPVETERVAREALSDQERDEE